MENKELLKDILSLKKEKNIRIIGHFYTPEEVQPVADILTDSRGFFEELRMLPDDKMDLMVLGPTFFAETARALLYNRDITVYTPCLCECPVANHRNLTYDKVLAFKQAHYGVPMVCYSTASLEAMFLGDYIAMPGDVASVIDSIDATEVLYVGDGNCALYAMKHCNKKVIPFPGNPFCNTYSSIDATDIYEARKAHPDGCLLIHPECNPEMAALADYSLGTGQMVDLIGKLNHKKFIIGAEIGFYHRIKKLFPDKDFVHLSPRLTCNTFKAIRLSNVLDSLVKGKEIVTVDPVIAKKIFDNVNKN